jgi:hypothetical protein
VDARPPAEHARGPGVQRLERCAERAVELQQALRVGRGGSLEPQSPCRKDERGEQKSADDQDDHCDIAAARMMIGTRHLPYQEIIACRRNMQEMKNA